MNDGVLNIPAEDAFKNPPEVSEVRSFKVETGGPNETRLSYVRVTGAPTIVQALYKGMRDQPSVERINRYSTTSVMDIIFTPAADAEAIRGVITTFVSNAWAKLLAELDEPEGKPQKTEVPQTIMVVTRA